jgi:hypothetical protein
MTKVRPATADSNVVLLPIKIPSFTKHFKMKQVLIVGAGHAFPEGPFAFLRGMKEQERVHARGLFFRPVDYSALAANSPGASLAPVMELEENEIEVIAANKALFTHQCEQYYIPYSLHKNDRQWDKDLLIKESRFADLILISGELFYADTDNNQPNQYLRKVLHSAECPVLVVPENFTSIEHLFIAYDGSRESLYAIKQFCYLFPEFTDLPAEVVYVNEEASDTIPDFDRLNQFTRLKFDSMSFSRLHIKASNSFATWISEKKNVLLVSGSFSRAPLSYLGRRSFAEDVIHDHQLPVFIAHNQL